MKSSSVLNKPIRWGKSMADFVLPTGTVTLMLADIEGSVRLWEAKGDRMSSVLSRFDHLVDELIGRHSGVRPKDQGEGDSFVAAFGRPSEAVACALQLQAALSNKESDLGEINLRIALHTGEVEFRDDANYVGSTINRCARLRDIAHGGQTLLSGSTFDLVAERLPESAFVKDLGTHRLRDLARPEHVYQLNFPGLRDDFPPLRSLEELPNNLPTQLTSFIGRERELEEVNELLTKTRMLTLTGSGGCGKTRLALQVAADQVEGFEDGVWLVDLASIRDPALVTGAFGSTLGVHEQKEVDSLQVLINRLKSQTVLIIVDNCEHLIADSATVSNSLLKGCPSLKVMATSREPLGVPGETTYRVPSLSLPKENSPLELEALPQFEAVRLFIERAVKSRPNFKISNENASAVVHICSRLDGIPLAIELAAARIRVLTPQQISDGLAHRFHLLTGGSRTVMPRQQTLQASVDWSYQLLTDAEGSLLDSLSVFSGGFTLDSGEAVCSYEGVEPHQVLDLLGRLVDKSLVIVDDDQGQAARYRLLETIRQYAMERLVEKERVEALRTRHMYHFVEFGKLHLEDASTLAAGVPREIQPEVDNFRAAVEWAAHLQDREVVIRLATHLSWILSALGQRREAANLLERALESDSDVPLDVLSRAWNVKGWVRLWFDVGRTALACGEKALELAEEAREDGLAMAARALIAQAAFMARDSDRLQTLTVELERSAQSGSFEHIFAISLRASAALDSGNLSDSKALFEEALELSKSSGNLMMVAYSQQHIGWSAIWLGDFDQAVEYLEASRESFELLDAPDLRYWLFSGQIDAYRGDYSIGREKLIGAHTRAKDQQLPNFEAIALAFLLWADLAEGDFTAAAEHGEQFDSITESLEDDPIMNTLVGLTADRYRVAGLNARGLERLRHIRVTAPRPGADLSVAIAAQREAKTHRDERDLRRAEPLAFESLEATHRFGAKPLLIECIELVAGLALDRESFEEAARLFGAAEAARRLIGYVRFAVDQPTYDSDVDRIKDALEEEVSSFWDAGSEMNLDEAVAYAMRGRGQRKRPSTGWASLTPAERRVADLVGDGLSNPQIAERLFISRNTVETHLKHIFSKLSITSRTQLANEVARNEVPSDD